MRNRIIIALWALLLAVSLGGFMVLSQPGASASPSEDCVPAEAWDEITDWTTEGPPSDEWLIYDERIIVDQEATSEVWANFSPDKSQGPFEGPPGWPNDPRGTWHVHDKIPGGHEGPDGVYQRDNPGTGNGDWFYRHNATEAVEHAEWRYVLSHDAIECPEPTDPPTDEPNCPIDQHDGKSRPVPGCDEPGTDIPKDEPKVGHPVKVTKDCIAGDLVIKKYVWSDTEGKYVFKSGSYGVDAKKCAEKLQGAPVKEEGF